MKVANKVRNLYELEFEDVVDIILKEFLQMLKEVGLYTNLDVPPKELYDIDRYRKTIVLFFPLKAGGEQFYHAVAIHYTERKWYTPPSKAKEHYRSACRVLNKALKKGKVKEDIVKDRTIILIGPTYTSRVKEVLKCWVLRDIDELNNILKNFIAHYKVR